VKQYPRQLEIEVRFFDFPPLLRAHRKVFGRTVSTGSSSVDGSRRDTTSSLLTALHSSSLGQSASVILPLAFSHASDLRDIQSPISDSD
jgi:hypothetical protein